MSSARDHRDYLFTVVLVPKLSGRIAALNLWYPLLEVRSVVERQVAAA